jgi:hypothetical protein
MARTATTTTLARRSLSRLALSTLIAGALLVGASAAHASQTVYDLAGKYAQCELKAIGRLVSGRSDIGQVQAMLSKCRTRYADAWVRLTNDARFVDNADGTVTDRLTGLQWEQKTDDASVHDKDNTYTWSTALFGTDADGTAYTSFLATLNGGGCFAGQCDWRLPTRAELQTILLAEPYPCATSPCIDQGVFGPTAAGYYWSSTTYASSPNEAWAVSFAIGAVEGVVKGAGLSVRAVRGGL